MRFLRGRDYLAVEAEPGLVDVLPISSSDRRSDRARAARDVELWRSQHPGRMVEPANGPATV